MALAPASLPRLEQVRMDGGVALLAAGLAVALGMVSGIVPVVALVGRRRDRLIATSRTVARGGKDVVRRGLVVLEMSLALLLLGGAGSTAAPASTANRRVNVVTSSCCVHARSMATPRCRSGTSVC